MTGEELPWTTGPSHDQTKPQTILFTPLFMKFYLEILKILFLFTAEKCAFLSVCRIAPKTLPFLSGFQCVVKRGFLKKDVYEVPTRFSVVLIHFVKIFAEFT